MYGYAPPKVRYQARVVEIVVAGLYGAGKSRFIKTVSQYTDWESKRRPGRGWYFGRVRVNRSLILHFLEPPTERQFDFIWMREQILKSDAMGYILLLDSTRPKTFGQFLTVLYSVRGYRPDTPCVVAANKQDHYRAWSADDIQLGLGITKDIPVLPCDARKLSSVKDVVLNLLYRVPQI